MSQKPYKRPSRSPMGQKTLSVMISTATCMKVLNSAGNRFTEEDVLRIRDFMYQLANLEISTVK